MSKMFPTIFARNTLGTKPLDAKPLGTNPLGTKPLGTKPLGTNQQTKKRAKLSEDTCVCDLSIVSSVTRAAVVLSCPFLS